MSNWNDIKKELLSVPEVMEEYYKLPSVEIAAAIINARAKKGLTQTELARLAGTSQTAIVRLERGNYNGYTLKTLVKIANALDTKLTIQFQNK